MSYYLNPNHALERLRADWNKHGSIIVAVDYDSTIIPYFNIEVGADFELIRQLVRDLKALGCTIIIFTASDEERWDDIKANLKELNIQWDYFNQSPPHIPNVGKAGKVYANAYLDDRAGLYEVYTHLKQLVTEKWLEKVMTETEQALRQMASP